MRDKQHWWIWGAVVVLLIRATIAGSAAPIIRAQDKDEPLWFVFQGMATAAYPKTGPFRVKLDGEHFQNLNHTSLDMYFQSWVPDNTGMIWVSESGNDDDLFWAPPDGWNEIALTHTIDIEERFFCWTPDGEWMLIQEKSSESLRLARMRSDGSDYQPLIALEEPSFAKFVAWSPSGEWILFFHHEPNDNYWPNDHKVLYRMHPDGTALQSLQPNDLYYDNDLITVSPDQRYIIIGGPFHPSTLFLVEPDAIPANINDVQAYIRALADIPASAQFIEANWSPNGEWLLLGIREKLDDDPTYDENDNFSIFRLRPDGSYFEGSESTGYGTYWQPLAKISAEFLHTVENEYWMPVWSPDSKWIVLADDIDGQTDLFRVQLDNNERTQLTDSPDFDDVPAAVSPDGRWVLGIAQEDYWTGGYLYQMYPDGSNWQSLLTVEDTRHHRDQFLMFTPDGQGVIFWHQHNANTSRSYSDFYHVQLDSLATTRLAPPNAHSNAYIRDNTAIGIVGWYPPQP